MRRIVLIVLLCLATTASAASKRYAERYCTDPRFHCVVAQKGEKWKALWPNDPERHLIMKLNRMNTGLVTGMKIVVPNDLAKATLLDVAPFPHTVDATGEKWILIKLSDLAWGAYDTDGKLVQWGPVAGGKDFCPDIQSPCRTVTGTFKILRKGNAKCKSNTYPVDNPGAPMPYCMFFHGGYAIHGSSNVPGYNASHGCVRVWVDDAKWLNEEFVDIGTKVVVEK